jgi:hypothetical protein
MADGPEAELTGSDLIEKANARLKAGHCAFWFVRGERHTA